MTNSQILNSLATILSSDGTLGTFMDEYFNQPEQFTNFNMFISGIENQIEFTIHEVGTSVKIDTDNKKITVDKTSSFGKKKTYELTQRRLESVINDCFGI